MLVAVIGCVGGLVRDGEVVLFRSDGSGTMEVGASEAAKLVKSRDAQWHGWRLLSVIAVGLLDASAWLEEWVAGGRGCR